MYLSGGTPLVDLVEHLGVEGALGVAPLTVGWGASVELIGSVISLTLLSLSTVAGVVTLVIGITGNIECPFNWLKSQKNTSWFFLQSSMAVLQPAAQNEKVETWA